MQTWKLWSVSSLYIFGLLSALLLVIVTSSRLSRSKHLSTLRRETSSLKYTGLLICPSHVSRGLSFVSGVAFSENPMALVNMPALIDVLGDTLASEAGYAACPRVLQFNNNDVEHPNLVICADFSPSPVLLETPPETASCDPDATSAYFFSVNQPDVGMHGSLPPKGLEWHARNPKSSLVFRAQSINSTGVPLQMFMYDDLNEVPKDFDEYTKTFGLEGVNTVELAMGTLMKVVVERVVRNRPATQADKHGAVDMYSKCDESKYTVKYATETNLGGVSEDSVSTVLSPFSLSVKTECYVHEFGFIEGAGIVGGVLAMTGSVIFLGVVCFKLYKKRAQNGAWGSLTDDERSMLLNSLVGGDDA